MQQTHPEKFFSIVIPAIVIQFFAILEYLSQVKRDLWK